MTTAAELLDRAATLSEWQQVPELVRARYKEAAPIARRIRDVVRRLPSQADYGYVFWHPEKKQIWAVLGDGDDQAVHNKYHNALKAIPGVMSVTSEAELHPPDQQDWVRIKRANSTLGVVAKPFEWAGKLTGGASPLSNALVGGLAAGGLGYGAGALMEQLFPERYVERGRLRKTLGLLGAGAGSIPGLWQANVNQRNATQAGQPLSWGGLTTPNADVPINQGALDSSDQLRAGSELLKASGERLDCRCPLPHPILAKAAAGFAQDAFGAGSALRPVPMDAFNQAIWNDVSKGMTASRNPFGTKSPWDDNNQPMHTPPAIGAATAGLVSGIDEMYGRPGLLSPQHFMSGLAAAGIDLATARVAGGILGALGGLTPAAQNTLQDMGIWGGLVRGVTSSVFGL